MMMVYFNDEPVNVSVTCTLQELLQQHGISPGCFSIALNQQFVSRNNYAKTLISPNDHIDLIKPMQGG